jgi:hypothetical protein
MHSHRRLTLSHVAFEDLGSLEALHLDRGIEIERVVAATVRLFPQQTES